MEVSTRGSEPGPDVGTWMGARHALRQALVFGPSFLPFLPCALIVLCVPWLGSLEAQAERDMVLLRSDALARQWLESWSTNLGGSGGALALGVLFCALWLLLLSHRRAWSPRSVAQALLARRGVPRSAVLLVMGCAALAVASIEFGASPLARWVDIAAGLRPTGTASLALVVASQGLVLLLLGGCAGAVVAALETARMPRARVGTLGILLGLGALGALAENLATGWIARRIDVGVSLATALGTSPQVLPRADIVIIARDRTWRIPVPSGIGDVPFDSALSMRAEEWNDKRRGWTLLADALESHVVGERLLALDPDGARQAYFRGLRWRSAAHSAHPLLASLGAAHPDAAAHEMLVELADAPWLERGPVALILIARAPGLQADRARAELALAQLRSLDGEERLASVRSVPPIVLAAMTDGRVSGVLSLDGRPLRGRVGLLSTQDLFERPALGRPVPVTWLLRLGGATTLGPDGSFTFERVGAGEHALVLIDTGGPNVLTHPPIPTALITRQSREVNLGEIALTRSAEISLAP